MKAFPGSRQEGWAQPTNKHVSNWIRKARFIGVGLALAISAIGIPMPPPPSANTGYTAMNRLDAVNLATAFLIGVLATALAAIFPARRVSRTELVEALRQRS